MSDQLIQAINLTIKNGFGCTSYLQMNMRIGYNLANKLMQEMEDLGVIGTQIGTKPRTLLIKSINELT